MKRQLIALVLAVTLAGVSNASAQGSAFGQEPSSHQTQRASTSGEAGANKFSIEAFNENSARARNNRLKAVPLADTHGVACARGVAAVHASGMRVALVIPTFVLEELGVRGRVRDPTFTFGRGSCRLAITISKFARLEGGDSEILLYEPDPNTDIAARLALEGRRRAMEAENSGANDRGPPQSDPNVSVEGNRIRLNTNNMDPDRVGFWDLPVVFASPVPVLNFSGMAWFGAKNFTLLLGSVPEELSIESRKDAATKTYMLDVTNNEARVRFSIKKEVLVGDSWVTEFSE
jgi:hypothetical protein